MLELYTAFWIAFLFAWIFLIGTVVGSFLNVCIARLPLEKSVVWPSSRCGHCLRSIPMRYNVPLFSYWLLGGRCYHCRTPFSMRYFLVELLTGLSFVLIYLLEVGFNVHRFETFGTSGFSYFQWAAFPPYSWWLFAYHAILICFLIVVSFCDLEHREIPLSITFTGTGVGLIGAVLLPWPFPSTAESAIQQPGSQPAAYVAPVDRADENRPIQGAMPANGPWWMAQQAPREGFYPWPVWGPVPQWLPAGSWQMGLASGLIGVLVGTLMLRAIRFLFSAGLGVEAMGLGDADLMMMVGAFLGWQIVVVAFFVSVIPALVCGVLQLLFRGDNTMPFGPSLALGSVVTWLGWSWIGPRVQIILFNGSLLMILVIVGAVLLVMLSFFFRLLRLSREAPPAVPGSRT